MRRAVTWACAQQVGDAGVKLVLLLLAHHAGQAGAVSRPVSSLAREVECSERTIKRSVQKLKALGLLVDTGQRRSTARGGLLPVYRLTIQARRVKS